jgi:transitional endoplasmic reticulum ATPase
MARAVDLVVANTNIISDGREAWVGTRLKKRLGLSYGDVVEIRAGKKSTVAVVWGAQMGEGGSDSIKLDDYMRHNLGTKVGAKVSVKKAIVRIAKSVTLRQPRGRGTTVNDNFIAYVKGRLRERPVIEGDIIPVSVSGVMLTLTVSKVAPSGVVRIAEKTAVTIH